MANTPEETPDKLKKEKLDKYPKTKAWLSMVSAIVVGGLLVTVITVMGKKTLHSLEQAMS